MLPKKQFVLRILGVDNQFCSYKLHRLRFFGWKLWMQTVNLQIKINTFFDFALWVWEFMRLKIFVIYILAWFVFLIFSSQRTQLWINSIFIRYILSQSNGGTIKKHKLPQATSPTRLLIGCRDVGNIGTWGTLDP